MDTTSPTTRPVFGPGGSAPSTHRARTAFALIDAAARAGGKLPSRSELCRNTGSMHATQEALAEMVREGFVRFEDHGHFRRALIPARPDAPMPAATLWTARRGHGNAALAVVTGREGGAA